MRKIKHFIESKQGKDIIIVLIIVLVGLASFELGRLSKNAEEKGIKIQYQGQDAAVINATPFLSKNEAGEGNLPNTAQSTSNSPKASSGAFFASSRGSKYYPTNCSAGKSIKVENRIYFDTRESAEKAGYTLSSSCR